MLTKNLMRQYDACWSDREYDTMRDLCGADALTPRQVADDERLSLSDRIWAVSTALVHRNREAAASLIAEVSADTHVSVFNLWDDMHTCDDPADRANLVRMLDLLGPDADGWTEVAP